MSSILVCMSVITSYSEALRERENLTSSIFLLETLYDLVSYEGQIENKCHLLLIMKDLYIS